MAKTAKTLAKKPAPAKPRRLKTPNYQSFKLQKKIKPGPRLPSAFQLFKAALGTIKRHWKLFLGIIAVYAFLNLLLVQGLSSMGGVEENKSVLEGVFSGDTAQILASATLFMQMLGASTSVSPAAGVYQLILTLIVSLALIWTLRHVYADSNIRIRDGFYQGMYPLVPFVLILCVIGLQLLPLILGAVMYSTVVSNSIAVGVLELILWGTAFFVLAVVSLYLVSSSLFALYIVCLPDVEPMQALRSARTLVLNRRWTVMRKVIFLPIALLVLGGLLLVPLIFFFAAAAGWVFFLFSMLTLAIIHSYMYGLYRSLI
jgi:hypothetical protein